MILTCNDCGCRKNMDGVCRSEVVSIEMKFGEFQDGERKCYHACQDFEGNDGDD